MVAGLITVLATPASPADTAGRALTPAAITRNLACDNNLGAGTGPDPAGTLNIGPVGLIGIVVSKPLTLARLSDGLLWFKTYIIIPRSKQHRVELSVRSLDGGKVGLDWGTQQYDNAKHPHYTPLSSLKTTRLSMPLCDGTSAGFPGGFVMTQPLCAQVTVTAGKVSRSDRLSFGGAPCPADAP